MIVVTRISAQTAGLRTEQGHFDVLYSDAEMFFIRSAASETLIGSRSSIESAIQFARSQALRFDREAASLKLAA